MRSGWVQDVDYSQCWALFLSPRETKVPSREKNHGGCRELEESPRDLCKGPRVAKQADGREVVS